MGVWVMVGLVAEKELHAAFAGQGAANHLETWFIFLVNGRLRHSVFPRRN